MTEKRRLYLQNYTMLGKSLSERQQLIYWLYYEKYMSCTDIAIQLKVTESCISGHLYKIKKKLNLPMCRGKRAE